jgi:riboflavin synthase
MTGMFTGLVEELATVAEVSRTGSHRYPNTMRLVIRAAIVAQDALLGHSIAVSGCCLTVVEKDRNLLMFDAGSETLSRTNFDRLAAGSHVNLERSLKLGDRLGGHLVTGHIDGLGTLIKRRDEDDWSHFTFSAHPRLLRLMASKGSIAIDGVSLTLVSVEEGRFSVALIPHTLKNTTLGLIQVGEVANLETDLIAKYVEKQLEARTVLSERIASP